jgi:outer membrane protein assembly factor BamB
MFNARGHSRPINFLALVSAACLLLCGLASAAPSIREGKFREATISVPKAAIPGRYTVRAEEQNGRAAQEGFVVRTNWRQFHRLDMERFNQYETVLSPKNVKKLEAVWHYAVDNAGSPVVADGMVYVTSWGSGSVVVFAFDESTGKLIKRYSVSGTFAGPSPAVENGVIYFGGDDTMYAVDGRTGATLWTYTTGGLLTDFAPTVVDGIVFFGSRDSNVYALDTHTGAKLWSYFTGSGDGHYPPSSPAVVNGVVYVSALSSVFALDASTGAEVWVYDMGWGIYSSPAVASGVLYIGNGGEEVEALNTADGTLLWTHAVRGTVWSSPAVAYGMVYIGAEDYLVHALDANTGDEVWNFDAGFYVEASPAVANGVVYAVARGMSSYALDAKTGAVLWNRKNDAYSSPIVVNGRVFLVGPGRIQAFGLPRAAGR